MFGMILTAAGVMMLIAGIPGIWITREALKNEGPHRPLFWVGGSLTAAAYLALSLTLIFNDSAWFGLSMGVAAAAYLIGVTLQRIARRR